MVSFLAPTLALGPGGASGHFKEVLGPHKLLGGLGGWIQIKEEIELIQINTKKILKAFVF